MKTPSFSDLDPDSDVDPVSSAGRLPRHIAIIMDGNGRWAKARGQPRVQGHRRGVEAARTATSLCGDTGIPYLTLFAFSSENWKRPDEEVRFLTQLLALSLEKELDRLDANGVKLNVIGEVGSFGRKIERTIQKAQEKTAGNGAMTLTIALNYGSRRELATAARNLAQSCIEGRLRPEEIDESLIPVGVKYFRLEINHLSSMARQRTSSVCTTELKRRCFARNAHVSQMGRAAAFLLISVAQRQFCFGCVC